MVGKGRWGVRQVRDATRSLGIAQGHSIMVRITPGGPYRRDESQLSKVRGGRARQGGTRRLG